MRRNVWRKSSRSGNDGACVEVRHRGHAVDVRDSKNPSGPVLTFTRAEWEAFLGGAGDGAGAKGGQFDLI
ncbi:MAG TPA: DUF397 domain-containing protein [Micromonosporaceae bacterium]